MLNPVFEYRTQGWIENGKYVCCGHTEDLNCQCYGKLHEGEAPNHQQDSDCQVGADDMCEICGVQHGDPCPDCGGRGFHLLTCVTMLAILSEAQR